MLDRPYYIYRHIRPDTGHVFYIGKGKNRRNHYGYERAIARESRNSLWHNIVKKNNGNYLIEIVMEFSSPELCVSKEIELISLYGRKDLGTGTLSNMTNGGDGSWGIIVSPELREKRRQQILGNKHPNWGKKLSDETCRKKSESVKGTKHHLFGKKLPDAWKENIRKSKFGTDNPMFGKITSVAKKVIDDSTGIIYNSISRAAIASNINPKTLYQYLDGTRPNKTTMRYA
jgi:NUMOD3 motif